MFKIKSYIFDLQNYRKPIIQNIITKKIQNLPRKTNHSVSFYWEAEDYSLDQSSAFNKLSQTQQQQILETLSEQRLEEAFHIEKSGIAFGAKMIAESTTYEERKLYAHFVGEESEHLSMIETYLSKVSEDIESNEFLHYLGHLIETASKPVLTFIIQVILEGWGIDHYSKMAKSCISKDLRETLNKIVQDEAGHHGSGVLLFEEKNLTDEEMAIIIQSFCDFLDMIRIGPAFLFKTLNQQAQLTSKEEIEKFLGEVKAHESNTYRLNYIKKLAQKSGAEKIVEICESRSKFISLSHSEMAQFYLGA